MVDNFYNYVKNRMRQMGVENFSMEPYYINETVVPGTPTLIPCYNEWLFLISESVHPNLQLWADNNLFNDAANYGNYNFNYLQEFTGELSANINNAELSATLELEFIRVIPEFDRKITTKK